MKICKRNTVTLPEKEGINYKINLWRQRNKTEACKTVEHFLQRSLDYSKNLKCICRSCLNQLKKGQKILSEGQLQLKGNQEKAEETFLRV